MNVIFIAQSVPQGDGSYIVRPGKPISELTPNQAAVALGLSRSSVYRRLMEGRLKARRPGPRKILISADSVEEWRKETEDSEYWLKR